MNEMAYRSSENRQRRERPSFFKNLRKALQKVFIPEKRPRKESIPVYKADVPDVDLIPAERAIRRADNWDQLYDAIKLIANIPTSSGKVFRSEDIQQRIYDAYYSENPQGSSSLIPRAFGLRNKYLQLLKQSFEERPIHNSVNELVMYGHSGGIKLRDPEKYHSQSVSTAMKTISQRMEARGLTIENNKMGAVKIAAEVVDQMMPYDHRGLAAHDVKADQAGSVTEIIFRHEVGVCRHRAPLLVAVLKKMGFDAYQITHAYTGSPFTHTLAYVADQEVGAFVNPGNKEDRWTVIPYHQYGQQNREGMYGGVKDFTFRTTTNHWREYDYNL